jgi:hypothetical protein
LADYEKNDDGYYVAAGTIGTTSEKPIKVLDANGAALQKKIGDTNPTFNMGLANNISFKNFSLYFLFDLKYGGVVYNRTKQWLYRDLRAADVDQSGKEEYQKHATDYYAALYDVNNITSHFVEDGTYLKLRELSLSYSLDKADLTGFLGGFFKGAKVGFIGRNLLTFTKYTGYDPEVAQPSSSSNVGYFQYFAFDAYGYPNYRTMSVSLEFKF